VILGCNDIEAKIFHAAGLADIGALKVNMGYRHEFTLRKKEPARAMPGRSSLRNEPSSKGVAFDSGLRLAPPFVFLSLR
jgi:hypothetical protein